uniref:Uncharacterized protein n=1 Tax=Scleropages formosus TaxID=113540 RepID=A0A8C9RD38_SCLFO
PSFCLWRAVLNPDNNVCLTGIQPQGERRKGKCVSGMLGGSGKRHTCVVDSNACLPSLLCDRIDSVWSPSP